MTEKEAATAPQATATDTVTCCKDNNNLADIQGIAAEILAECKEYSLPIWGLPRYAQDIINDVSAVRQCPKDFATIAVMAATSAAVGKRLIVSDKYDNSLMTWAVIIAPSGSAKSQPLNDIFKPLESLDAASYKEYRHQLKDWKAGDQTADEPIFKQIFIDDTTPEARNKAMATNTDGITLYRDELAGMIDDIGRYNHSGEVAQMLSIYDSKNIVINRKSDGPMLIEKPFMNIIGTIQPDVFPQTFGRPSLVNNGFVQRFLFVFPDGIEFGMYEDNQLNDTTCSTWNDALLQLHETDYTQPMRLSDDAKRIYADYFNVTQKQIEDATDGYTQASLAKSEIQVIRIAGITQLLHTLLGGGLNITGDSMRYAVECMEYFKHTAAKVGELISNGSTPPPPTKGEAIRQIIGCYPDTVKSKLADALGITKQTIQENLKK